MELHAFISLPLSHTCTLLLTADQSIWHPQGQQSSTLGPRHYRACSAYPPPLPPPHPPPFFFFFIFFFSIPIILSLQKSSSACSSWGFWWTLLSHKTFAKEEKLNEVKGMKGIHSNWNCVSNVNTFYQHYRRMNKCVQEPGQSLTLAGFIVWSDLILNGNFSQSSLCLEFEPESLT